MKALALIARMWVFSLVAFGAAQPAFAQDVPKLGVTLGYSTLRIAPNPCEGCEWNWYQLGFNIDGAVPIRNQWQVVGEFGWARRPFREDPSMHVGGLNAINAGGGLRWTGSRPSFAPFAQFVVGLHRDSYNGGEGVGLLSFTGPGIPANSFMVQPGAGVVVPISPGWGFVGQVDYRRVFADEPMDAVRFVFGIRIDSK